MQDAGDEDIRRLCSAADAEQISRKRRTNPFKASLRKAKHGVKGSVAYVREKVFPQGLS